MNLQHNIFKSWSDKSDPVHKTEDLLSWIKQLNNSINVSISKCSLVECTGWFYDEPNGMIRNEKNAFFQISGIELFNRESLISQQPILVQNEIGYLGIITKLINGTLHFLMQAKIEPGNVNKVQISPTIQATFSNFTQKHGGRQPAYLKYFIDAKKYRIIYDQIQSEQSSRFIGKRNRNIIIQVDEDVEELDNFRWMTLYQIKQIMKKPNLVNMDTRTVLSGLPIDIESNADEVEEFFKDKALLNSMSQVEKSIIPRIYQHINDFKMFSGYNRKLIPLNQLDNWSFNVDGEFVCNSPNNFKVVFCDISIDGREVKHWKQPLFEANERAMFGLFTCIDEGVRKFLVHTKYEIGAFDLMEIGPTIQREAVENEKDDSVTSLFLQKLSNNEGVIFNNVLSEEGGRFYHEENDNVIIEIDKHELVYLPEDYFWVNYNTLNHLVKFNNTLNIQLRNLISLLEI